MRNKIEFLAAECRAKSAKTANDFVTPHEHLVVGANRHDLLEIASRRHDHAAGSHDRLGDEGGYGLRAFLYDQLVKLGGEPGCKLLFLFALLCEAVVMRAAGVQKTGEREIEIAMIGGVGGQWHPSL